MRLEHPHLFGEGASPRCQVSARIRTRGSASRSWPSVKVSGFS